MSDQAPPGKKPIALLVAHDVKDEGGMERCLAELIRQCSGEYSFVVVSSRLDEQLRPLVARWVRVPSPRRPFPLRFVWFWFAAAPRVKAARSDLTITTGAIVPNRVDIAAVMYCHRAYRAAVGAWSSPDTPLLRRWSGGLGHHLSALAERWCYRKGRVRVLTAPSSGLREELEAYFPGVPVALVPQGVDSVRFSPDPERRRRRDAREGRLVAAFVGGDWYRKGLLLAIEAVAAARRRGADIELWVHGPGQTRHFQRAAAALGLDGAVRFLGAPPEVERTCQAADLLLLPSTYETFSLVAHEAAACGLPVVATPVHGVTDLVRDGAAGSLVPPSAEAIGDALFAYWEDPQLRRRHGEAGRRHVLALSWSRYGERSAEVFRNVLDAGGAVG